VTRDGIVVNLSCYGDKIWLNIAKTTTSRKCRSQIPERRSTTCSRQQIVGETVMRLLKDDVLVLIPETAEEEAEITTWKSSRGDQVFCLRPSESPSVELHQLVPRVEACREPINAMSNSVDPNARLISNFAATPFDLDGRHYQSVESIWQGLKFPDERDRRRVAELDGPQAR
jgi:hypothetical protein